MKKLLLYELNRKEIRNQLDEIIKYVDDEVHPAVSPDRWYVYSNLHDEITQLKILLEQNNVI